LCQLFSKLPNGNDSIIEERDSIIGQPDCFAMNPYWPESLINTNSIEEERGLNNFTDMSDMQNLDKISKML
jgi:hypothetical protein